jgi:hypothetical protein
MSGNQKDRLVLVCSVVRHSIFPNIVAGWVCGFSPKLIIITCTPWEQEPCKHLECIGGGEACQTVTPLRQQCAEGTPAHSDTPTPNFRINHNWWSLIRADHEGMFTLAIFFMFTLAIHLLMDVNEQMNCECIEYKFFVCLHGDKIYNSFVCGNST